MKKIKLYITIFLLSLVSFSFAQKKGSFQKNYGIAKTQLNGGQYEQAFDSFKNLMVKHKNNPYAKYAHYYCGLSAYRLKKYTDARFVLVKLIQDYPKWKEIEEAYYLMAIVSLDENDFEKSAVYTNQIEDEILQHDFDNILSQKVNPEMGIEKLNALHELFPKSIVVAKNLYIALGKEDKNTTTVFNQKYLAQEYSLFNVDTTTLQTEEEIVTIKGVYNVAVILPFDITSPAKKKSPYYELYIGIELAIDSLNENGRKIKLHVFDTKGDTLVVKALIHQKKLADMDMLIGPISYRESQLVAKYAKKKKMYYINPLSHKTELLKDNSYVFLYMSSFRKKAEKLAEFSKKEFSGRNIIIYYGESEQDSVMATVYKNTYEGLDGKTVTVFKKLTKKNMTEISKDIHRLKFSKDASHVFVVSKNKLIGSYVITALETDKFEIPVLAPYSWLKIPTNSYEQYVHFNTHFYKDYYVDLNNDRIASFRKKVSQELGIRPRKEYAHIGYDLTLHFGNALITDGRFFGKKLIRQSYRLGATLQGLDYTDENSNDICTILKFDENRRLIWINTPKNGDKK